LLAGYGYKITSADVWAAYTGVMAAAQELDTVDQTRGEIAQLVAGEPMPRFVAEVLAGELER
jgi:hypothetical protein